MKITYDKRLQFSFLFFICLPILLVSIFTFGLVKQSMIDKVLASNENFLHIINAEISRAIDDISFSSYFIVNDGSFKEQLTKFSKVKRLNSHEDNQLYQQIEADLSLVSSKPLNNDIKMFLVNPQNFIISSTVGPEIESLKFNLQKLITQVDQQQFGTMQWLGMYYDDLNKDGYYYIARVIPDQDNNEVISILFANISASYFDSLLEPIQFGEVALYDKMGTRLTSKEGPSYVLSDHSKKVIRSEHIIQKNNWKLAYETTEDELLGSIPRFFSAGIMVVILFAIGFSVSSVYIAKRLYSPIMKLQRVVRQFAKGNLDVRLEIKGKDDIAELGSTLNDMLDQIQKLIHDMEQAQEQKRVMELETLFMQIRPHFLINTLNSIKCSLILRQDKHHSGVIDSLMSLLRAYLKVNEPITLKEECLLLQHYVDIMKVRNDIELSLSIEIEEEVMLFIIPKLILQPIVENSIVHGLVDMEQPKVSIKAYREQQWIMIEIMDNGCGIEESQLIKLNNLLSNQNQTYEEYPRVGLLNVVQRFKLTFGATTELRLSSNKQGSLTTIRIPMPTNYIRKEVEIHA